MREYLYFTHRKYFSLRNLYFFSIIFGVVGGIWQRELWVYSMAAASFSAYEFFKTKKIFESLVVHRLPSKGKALEFEDIISEIEVKNQSNFSLYDLVIVDDFDGSSKRLREVISKPIPAFSQRRMMRKRPLDVGMGHFQWGALTIIVSDFLGLFEFRRTVPPAGWVTVYPKLEKIGEQRFLGSKESFGQGDREVQAKGISPQFLGVRDYVKGDPLRHIHWKLSFRYGKLVVKEFEKTVHSEITVLVDNSGRSHFSSGAHSTWECARDLTLALVNDLCEKGHSVQVGTHSFYIPWGSGISHSQYITMSMPSATLVEENLRSLSGAYADLASKGGSAVYIGTFFEGAEEALFSELNVLCAACTEVKAFLFFGPSYLNEDHISFSNNLKIFDDFKIRLARLPAQVRLIQNGQPIDGVANA